MAFTNGVLIINRALVCLLWETYTTNLGADRSPIRNREIGGSNKEMTTLWTVRYRHTQGDDVVVLWLCWLKN